MVSSSIPTDMQTTAIALADSIDTKGKPRSKVSQEKGWANILALAKRTVAARPDDHLSSILAELREVNIGRKDPGRFYRVRDLARPLGNSIMAQAGLDVEETFLYPDVTNSEYRLSALSPIRYLAGLIRPDTSGVMEVGSGWSSNIFQTYLTHGATRSKSIIYYGGEYTTEGQVCAKYLARQDPLLNYRAFYFDYRNPNVEFLVRQKGHILLFTSHSIEQVDIINPALFDQLRAIPNPVTVVHFEPVGWQRIPELMARREAGDSAFFDAIGARVLQGDITTGAANAVAENSAWWSWRADYNKNLLPLLRGLESDGAIRMVREVYDYAGHANVLNPATLLHYEFVR